MSRSKGLSPSEHVEVGALLKEARTNLLIAARLCRVYGRLSDQLVELADGSMSQRAWLERRLIDAVGADGVIDGVHVRDVYFGTVMEKV
jgi:hypothetical protein